MEKLTRKAPNIAIRMMVVTSAALLLDASTGSSAQVYSWKDGNGVFHFAPTPHPGASRFPVERGALTSREGESLRRRGPTARYDHLIFEYAERYDVEPELVKALIHVESNFDSYAVSRRGARGLMQLMPRTARHYGAGDLHDPRENIHAGVLHLRNLLDRFESLRLAIAAYNAGAAAVRRHRGLPPYRETRSYVERVLRFRASYRKE